MNRRFLGFILLLTVLLLAGCGGEGLSVMSTPTPMPTPSPTPAPQDGPLPLELPEALTDGDAATWATGQIVLRSPDRLIGSLYLEWSHTPGEWSMTVDGVPVTVKKNGFLHQYFELPMAATEVVIDISSALCDIYAFEKNSRLPDWVQVWQPPHDQCDLLLLPTHADDELVFFGGMIPYYAVERGYKVQVVYLTNHWSQVLRPHELLDALWHAGMRNYPIIGPFEDAWADTLKEAEEGISRYDAASYLTAQIRRFKPSVVIGHDLKGEYGHGQHVLCALALTDAIVAATDGDIFPESARRYGTWNTPKLYLHLYPENEIRMNWDGPLASFGGKTALNIAQEAFDFHESQQGYFHVYGAGEDWDSRRFGLYRTTVGPDTIGGDVFENITEFY